ncbi:hypothetical protein CC86DRAFT_353999 [Ophiobolus disseminans]|uniref:Ribosomal RNA-processing protein 8 n=1 Tax=Ophiobolus disseminans TaxID=1469910 RepID=A0A6A6ZU95_9PLEO|nr:hypothetical protein CC86DRAFT_353999 [Ophiobolus disseminans]
MFSVPGWNVSAPIATQVEKPKAKDANKQGKKAQKRKEKQEHEVNAENVGELWNKITDGKDATPRQTPAVTQNGVEETGDDAQEKRGKKRKRGKSHKDKEQSADAVAKAEASPSVAELGPSGEISDRSAQKPTTADSEAKRDKKKRKKEQKENKVQTAASITAVISQSVNLTSLIPEPAGLTALQKSMRSKLASARFRHLNESLYTKPSVDSLSLFKQDPSMFEDYHRGFAQQVEVWPENPVDGYVNSILARAKANTREPKQRRDRKGTKQQEDEPSEVVRRTGDAKPLMRTHNQCTIADLGCGTASLSYRLQPHVKALNLTLHSFDLSKPTGPSHDLVTVADISSLPLQDASVDVAIFCLALMGTNWLDFIDEAYRVLHWKGELWVSEIKSRFGRVERKKGGVPINSIGSLRKPAKSRKGKDKPEQEGPQDSADEAELAERVDGADGKEGTDVTAFVDVLGKRGFVLDALPERPSEAIDLSNKMFVKMQFIKAAQPVSGKHVKKADAGPKPGGDRGMKFGMKGKKFGIVSEVGADESDKKVLKPCLYKIR